MAPARGMRDHLCLGSIVAVTLLAAVLLYRGVLSDPDALWDNPTHDRNGHYLFAVDLTKDLQHRDLFQLVSDLDKAQIWPPLHGVLLAAVLLVLGVDHHYAPLPSLAAWFGTAIIAFLIARRIAPRRGNLAGSAAALLVLTSPAHRAFATDVMLESLGAFLSLLTLYLYIRAVERDSVSAWRVLGCALTALFVCKGNYWVLVVLALLAAAAPHHIVALWRSLRDAAASFDWIAWGQRQLRSPWNYALGVVLLLIALALMPGTGALRIAGRTVSLYPPRLLLTCAYAIVMLRAVQWWRTAPRRWWHAMDRRAHAIIVWHVVPVAIWFLWPRRLWSFLWHVSPANAPPAVTSLSSSFLFYSQGLLSEYHAGAALALLVFVSIAVAASLRETRARGSVAVLCFVVIAACLTVAHPNHQLRYVHSWFAATWVLAGVGLAALADAVARRSRQLNATLPAVCVALLVTVLAVEHARVGGAESGPRRPMRTLALSDAYLPALVQSQRTAVLAAVPIEQLVRWTFLERYPDRTRRDLAFREVRHPDLERGDLEGWLTACNCDTVVAIDAPSSSGWLPSSATGSVPIHQLLATQPQLELVSAHDVFNAPDAWRVTVWRR